MPILAHGQPGVWIEFGPAGQPVMLRHPANPFLRPWPESRTFEAARDYVFAYRHLLRLDPDAIAGLNDDPLREWKPNRSEEIPGGLTLRWLPLDSKDFRRSYLVRRNPQRGSKDESAILLAALWKRSGGHDQVYLGPRALRLRVVFHATGRGAERQARFTGMSRSAGEMQTEELTGTFSATKGPKPRNAADVFGEVLPLDPPSEGGSATILARRPNRNSAAFAPAQRRVSLGPLEVTAGRAALRTADVEVINSYLLSGDRPLPGPKSVPVHQVAGQWEVVENRARTNDFAAVNAFYHSRRLMDRVASSGFDLDAYFRCASLPIWVRYRSGVVRAPHGNARNADAVWGKPPDLRATPAIKGEILLRYALGDLSISPAHFPLGIACDVRWNCHEFGHVLLMGSVGEREFRFAHSAGDSIAAILADPDSDLGLPQHNGGWRGVTFPWVALSRRHDRQPTQGWAWGGPLDRPEHGYWKEQILSSTLFRLYRTLGGDAVTGSGLADAQARRAASDHTLYLLIHAIGLLGAADVVATNSPDQLVSALIDADIGTAKFVTGNGRERVGGNAHKVIRWAFEQQGLYPGAATERPVRVAGDPPPVDVYIASALNGNYSWQAPAYQIAVNNPQKNVANPVQVTVGNRGANAAPGTNVALWTARANAGIPDWLDARWQKVDERAVAIPARSAGVPVQLNWTPAHHGAYALLAIVSCDEDRANTLPATALPCALNGSPIPQLLTGDNNLGMTETNVT
jgi:hypothetical protein